MCLRDGACLKELVTQHGGRDKRDWLMLGLTTVLIYCNVSAEWVSPHEQWEHASHELPLWPDADSFQRASRAIHVRPPKTRGPPRPPFSHLLRRLTNGVDNRPRSDVRYFRQQRLEWETERYPTSDMWYNASECGWKRNYSVARNVKKRESFTVHFADGALIPLPTSWNLVTPAVR